MEIFSPGEVPYPGCYQCPRCNSREVYDSERTIGVSAITINNPGPVDSTIVNVDKIDAKRCRYCNTVAVYLMHPKRKKEVEQLKKLRAEKIFKRIGVFASALTVLVLLSFLYSGFQQRSQDNAIKNQKETLEAEYSKWQQVASDCGLNERVDIWREATTFDPPHVDLGLFVEPAKNLGTFWKEGQGLALDCFSEKVLGFPLSLHFSYSDSEISNLSDFDGRRLYDETFTDGLSKGLLGQGTNYQSYISFSKKDSRHKDDYFFIYLSWQNEPVN